MLEFNCISWLIRLSNHKSVSNHWVYPEWKCLCNCNNSYR